MSQREGSFDSFFSPSMIYGLVFYCYVLFMFTIRKEKRKNCVIINAHNKQKAHRVIPNLCKQQWHRPEQSFISQREYLAIQLNNMKPLFE